MTDLAPEDIGVTLFPLPPDDFDPLSAGDEDLRAYGFPERPQPGHGPSRHARWRHIVSGTRWIQPTFATVPIRRGISGPWPPIVIGPASPGNPPPPPPTFGSTSNWAGMVAFADVGDAFQSVAGGWTVPNVTGPTGADSGADSGLGSICATWIGFDGSQLDGETTGTDLVQAGTTRFLVDVFGIRLPLTYAWWEWVPDDPVTISNLPVDAGDFMFCEITVRSPSVAAFSMTNVTSGVSVSFLGSPSKPSKQARLVGGSAEWILERPVDGNGNPNYALGRYGRVFFDECSATNGKNVRALAGADQVTMVTDQNQPISTPTVLGDSTFRVDWSSGEAVF